MTYVIDAHTTAPIEEDYINKEEVEEEGSKPVTWTDASGCEVGVVTLAAGADFQGTQS